MWHKNKYFSIQIRESVCSIFKIHWHNSNTSPQIWIQKFISHYCINLFIHAAVKIHLTRSLFTAESLVYWTVLISISTGSFLQVFTCRREINFERDNSKVLRKVTSVPCKISSYVSLITYSKSKFIIRSDSVCEIQHLTNTAGRVSGRETYIINFKLNFRNVMINTLSNIND